MEDLFKDQTVGAIVETMKEAANNLTLKDDTPIERVRFADESYYRMGTDEDDNDIYFPSSTFVLNWHPKGYGFTQWLKDVGENSKQIIERAAESGSLVHNAVDSFLKGQELKWDDNVYSKLEWKGVCRFMDFYQTMKPKIIAQDMTVFSKTYKYAGTLDLVCDIGDERWLIDFKFSNNVWDTHFFQIASYMVAFDEMVQEDIPKIDRLGILHLKAGTKIKDEKKMQGEGWRLIDPALDPHIKRVCKKRDVDAYGLMFTKFSHALDTFYFENPDPKPKNEEYPASFKVEDFDFSEE